MNSFILCISSHLTLVATPYLQACLLLTGLAACTVSAKPTDNWQSVVRATPYNHAKGLYQNLSSIRQWVLNSQGFCEKRDRHVLYNSRGQHLGWFSNARSISATQDKLNRVRQTMYDKKKIKHWTPGTHERIGYPFALNCKQPHVDLERALQRMLGNKDKLWGTWDGMQLGSKQQPVTLAKVIDSVFDFKSKQLNFDYSQAIKSQFFGQVIIESGAKKNAKSAANAVGLLQLRPEVLKDCGLEPKFHLHRMAQIDCAVRLYIINDRNLKPAFAKVFAHLPENKQATLYAMLLVQAYHGGIGRIQKLLGDGDEGKAAKYFAKHAQHYSAEDIALGMVFHNMGRSDFGLASLYYVIDVNIAAKAVCKRFSAAC